MVTLSDPYYPQGAVKLCVPEIERRLNHIGQSQTSCSAEKKNQTITRKEETIAQKDETIAELRQ